MAVCVVAVGCFRAHERRGPGVDAGPVDARVGRDGGSSECRMPVGQLRNAEELLFPGRCQIVGNDEAFDFWEIDCDGRRCSLIWEGIRLCECERLDRSSTCSNGIPTCLDWRPYIDWSTVRRSDTESR